MLSTSSGACGATGMTNNLTVFAPSASGKLLYGIGDKALPEPVYLPLLPLQPKFIASARRLLIYDRHVQVIWLLTSLQ